MDPKGRQGRRVPAPLRAGSTSGRNDYRSRENPHGKGSPTLDVAQHAGTLSQGLHSGTWEKALSSSHLSSWPAYAPGQAILQNRKPCTLPQWQSTSRDHVPLSITKPRYLEDLESHLRRELQVLDLTKGKFQELKLQPYREVFEFFMEEFKTYKPFLASIKNEYEQTIAHLQEKIHSLEAVNGILVTASDQYTQQILAFQQQEKIEITKLKEEKLYLLKLIDKMKEEKCSLEAQVAKMRKTVAEEYLRYLNECDARKMLLLDLNEMYRQKEELKLAKAQDSKGEDTVKLTLALKMARQDLTKVQVELNTMRANYGDVVPRREFELQEQKYNELADKMATLQTDFDNLQEEYETILEVYKQVSEERDQFCNDLINVQRSSTPRPKWSKCADVIPGGPERWSVLSEGKSSDQLVDVLLEDLGTALLRETETFVGRGRSDKIPVYLRCDGLVRNKKLTRKETVGILREIWREKIASDQQRGRRSSLSEFFLTFFQKKYGEALAFDWTYTVYENIKLYQSNEAMSLFHQILTGNLDEGVYHSHLQELSNLLKELTAADTANTGELMSEQFTLALKAAFPLKTDEEIQELTEAAGYKSEYDTIMYKLLFLEDEEGKTEPLIMKLKSQYISEKKTYLQELRDELGTLMEVRPDDLKAALCTIDHGLTEQTLDSHICYAFQVPKEQLDPAATIPIDKLMQRLMTADIRRQGTVLGEINYLPPSHTIEETELPAST
ncbi:translin-associated factor X-interacting protein 1 isoform X2 [Varanus komodoensis]|uniref:translin-associated factor X-interacting protein 1 isoform X2 n=1 Tax=Varanus komodoensis TaxID=61221 RepID=UPI001CF7999E|nr:translin-associated factor X-interacting protein 1 isoform X2 [Varanus komodoensis]